MPTSPQRRYRKRAIPIPVRRAVVQRAGAVFGSTVDVRCHWCPMVGSIAWTQAWYWPGIVGLELDHVVPEFAGGASTVDNIVLACRSCNRRRGHRHGATAPAGGGR